MENENIGYVKDWTTCKGGENLTEQEQEEITKELETQWGGGK